MLGATEVVLFCIPLQPKQKFLHKASHRRDFEQPLGLPVTFGACLRIEEKKVNSSHLFILSPQTQTVISESLQDGPYSRSAEYYMVRTLCTGYVPIQLYTGIGN